METKFATFGSRLQALLADSFLLSVVTYLVNFVLSPLYPVATDIKSVIQIFILSMVIYIIISTLYHVISWTRFDGATVGKKLAGIKIIRDDGSPINISSAILRIVGYCISTLVIGLGYLWVLWDKNKQGWHDKIAKTYVIKTDSKPRKKLLWAFIVGFLVISGVNGNIGRYDQEASLLNPDGSPADKITPNTLVATTVYEGNGIVKEGEYWGYEFEFNEKTNLNLNIETDYNAYVCIVVKSEFQKFLNGESPSCIYEVTTNLSRVLLEAGEYVFLIVSDDKDVNYTLSLKATNI